MYSRTESFYKTFLLLLLLVCANSGGTVFAQANGTGNGGQDKIPAPPFELTTSTIEERISSLQEREGLEASTREEIKKAYQTALDELKAAEEYATRISEYKAVQKNGSSEIEKLNKQLEELQSAPDLKVPEDASMDQLLKEIEKTDAYVPVEPELSFLQQELNDRQSELSAVQSSLEEVTEKLNKSKSRRENNQKLLVEAKDELDDVTSKLTSLSLSDSPNEATVAELVKLHARKKKLETRIEALNLEKETYETRRNLLQAQESFLNARKKRLETVVQLWQKVVSQNMEQKAQKDLEETKQVLKQVDETLPFIKKLKKEITALARERTVESGPIQGAKNVTERLKGIRSIRSSIEGDLKNVKERIQAAGLTHQLGSILRRKKEELPPVNSHKSDIAKLEQKQSDAQIRLIELNEVKNTLIQNKDEWISEQMKEVSEDQREEIRTKITELLNRKLGIIEKLIEEYDRYFNQITDLIVEKRKLVGVLNDYRTYIDERVIWIRSTSNLFRFSRARSKKGTDTEFEQEPAVAGCETPSDVDANIMEVPEAIQCFFQFSHWKTVVRAGFSDFLESYLFYIVVLLLLSVLLWNRSEYFRHLSKASESTFSRHGDSFLKTFNALLYTAFITIPVPGLLLFLGWRFTQVSSFEGTFSYAFGVALVGTGLYSVTLVWLRNSCHPDGLGRNHFRWTRDNIQQIRANILYFLYPTIPLVFLFEMTNHIDNRFYRDSLGRFLFLIVMLMMAWFVQRVLSPGEGILSDYLEEHRGGWLDRMKYLWYPLLIGVPIALAVLTSLGYYYTARQLMYRLSLSFVAFLGLLYLVEIFVRWQIYKNIEYAVQKRKEEREAAQEGETDSTDVSESMTDSEQDSFSLPSVNEQTQQLLWSFFWVGLLVGLWLIWADVLPALGMLDEVELWTHPEQVLETVTGEEGESIQRSVERQMPVTLADILLGFLIIVMTVIVSKNLPGLLEITLLHYLPMDQGLRYAYKTISRYIIVVLGIVGAAAMFGIRWGDIQWLVAGVSVGLGFGLQEIFANFVSGIILLFERPIRVGDTITVNDVTGRVTRIRTRATTIQDLDRKELVVPNRDFIQGELVNWTLSDSIMRVVIPIGVAYGSDTDLVENKLMEITRQEDIVLNDPEPNVIFTGFGDNALQFSLRFFIESYDNYWKAFHRVNRAVDKSFKEAGITIAFPQRDLHLKSVDDDVSVRFSPDDIPAPDKGDEHGMEDSSGEET